MDAATVDRIQQLAVLGTAPHDHPAGGQVRILPEGFDVHRLEPHRPTGKMVFTDPESVASYVNIYKGLDGRTIALCDRKAGLIKVLLNWHEDTVTEAGPDQSAIAGKLVANHGDHHAIFRPLYDDRFAAWNNLHHSMMKQVSFAEFLEDRALDITEPDSAEILEVARDLEVHRNATFKGGQKLQSGSYSFQAVEENRASTKTSVEIPSHFKLRVPVFTGQPAIEVMVALRYRVTELGVCFKLVIHRRDEIIAEAFDGLRHEITHKTGLTMMNAVLDECSL